jgi:hypothetical protein
MRNAECGMRMQGNLEILILAYENTKWDFLNAKYETWN